MSINFNPEILLFLKASLAVLFLMDIAAILYIQHTIKVRRTVKQKIPTKQQQDALFAGVWMALGLLSMLVWVMNW